jgi:hypothetical protein
MGEGCCSGGRLEVDTREDDKNARAGLCGRRSVELEDYM